MFSLPRHRGPHFTLQHLRAEKKLWDLWYRRELSLTRSIKMDALLYTMQPPKTDMRYWLRYMESCTCFPLFLEVQLLLPLHLGSSNILKTLLSAFFETLKKSTVFCIAWQWNLSQTHGFCKFLGLKIFYLKQDAHTEIFYSYGIRIHVYMWKKFLLLFFVCILDCVDAPGKWSWPQCNWQAGLYSAAQSICQGQLPAYPAASQTERFHQHPGLTGQHTTVCRNKYLSHLADTHKYNWFWEAGWRGLEWPDCYKRAFVPFFLLSEETWEYCFACTFSCDCRIVVGCLLLRLGPKSSIPMSATKI